MMIQERCAHPAGNPLATIVFNIKCQAEMTNRMATIRNSFRILGRSLYTGHLIPELQLDEDSSSPQSIPHRQHLSQRMPACYSPH